MIGMLVTPYAEEAFAYMKAQFPKLWVSVLYTYKPINNSVTKEHTAVAMAIVAVLIILIVTFSK